VFEQKRDIIFNDVEEDEWVETERKMDTLLNCVRLIKN
jgi:hypothetical protein